jgi:hypothetical protein
MQGKNIALITDNTLIEAAALIKKGIVTPSSLFAANSLVQAVILHDQVILGVAGLASISHESIPFIHNELSAEVSRVPKVGDFQKEISEVPGAEDEYPNILYWVASERPVANAELDSEVDHFSVVLDYLRVKDLSDITDENALEEKFGIGKPFAGPQVEILDKKLFDSFNKDVVEKGGISFTPNDLFALRDLAWTAAAGYNLSALLNMEVYHSLLERPFYANELKKPHGPLNLPKQAEAELGNVTLNCKEIDIPPFLGLILKEKSFDRKHFFSFLLESRKKHQSFRKAVSEFNYEFNAVNTKGEQLKLVKEYEDAWKALIDRTEYYSKERITYFLGRWAANPIKALMEDLIRRDQYNQRIDRVGGLVKLWKDLQDIVPSNDGRTVLNKFFNKLPTTNHWEKVQKLLKHVNSAAGLNEES